MENKELSFEKYRDVLVEVEKIEDTAFQGNHPNGYDVGAVISGVVNADMSKTYQCLFLITSATSYWHTSQVLEILEQDEFDTIRTLNSIYRLKIK